MKHLGIIAVAGFALFFFSCKSKDVKPKNSPAGSANTEASGKEAVKNDVLIHIFDSKDHSSLVAAIKQAQLSEPLQNFVPFTFFAPNNAAFEKMPKALLDTLMSQGHEDKLANIVQYHMTVGVFKEGMLQDGQTLGQANNQDIHIAKKDGKIRINDKANVVGVIPVTNGMIYIIDAVLIPPMQ